MPHVAWSGFGAVAEVIRILEHWRQSGFDAARLAYIATFGDLDLQSNSSSPLLEELRLRLLGASGPRLLVDAIWLSRPHGGITRVWETVLGCWTLPGLVTDQSPVCLIDRESCLSLSEPFLSLTAPAMDPLDYGRLQEVAQHNSRLVGQWSADVFLSSWITSSSPEQPRCPEICLVHDCIPERSSTTTAEERRLRDRWLLGASNHLAVSAATAGDLAQLLARSAAAMPWCHPSTAHVFRLSERPTDPAWLQSRFGLPKRFVLMPASGKVGSYKNPEVVLQAFTDPSLQDLPLVVFGPEAQRCAALFEQRWPQLKTRLFPASFTDLDLALAYQEAVAVVIPSRIEGFGLPVLEVLASGGCLITSDAKALREAAGGAALQFPMDSPQELLRLIHVLNDLDTGPWLAGHLQRRTQHRLRDVNADLLGLALLALARQASRPRGD